MRNPFTGKLNATQVITHIEREREVITHRERERESTQTASFGTLVS